MSTVYKHILHKTYYETTLLNILFKFWLSQFDGDYLLQNENKVLFTSIIAVGVVLNLLETILLDYAT